MTYSRRCTTSATPGLAEPQRCRLRGHHHLDELLVVDLAVTVDVGLPNIV
jgi:hypothetical protein